MNIEAKKSNAPKKAKHQHDVTLAQEEGNNLVDNYCKNDSFNSI